METLTRLGKGLIQRAGKAFGGINWMMVSAIFMSSDQTAGLGKIMQIGSAGPCHWLAVSTQYNFAFCSTRLMANLNYGISQVSVLVICFFASISVGFVIGFR